MLIPAWFYWGMLKAYVGPPRQLHPKVDVAEARGVKGTTDYLTARERDIVSWLFRIDMGLLTFVVLGAVASGSPLGRRPPKSN